MHYFGIPRHTSTGQIVIAYKSLTEYVLNFRSKSAKFECRLTALFTGAQEDNVAALCDTFRTVYNDLRCTTSA